MLLADFRAYVDCQDLVSQVYAEPAEWTRRSILNVARIGYFSSDRSITDYCQKIWKVSPVAINPDRKPSVDIPSLTLKPQKPARARRQVKTARGV
jgi:starch phosphorylase